jgi:hypothetical protein
MNPLNGQDSRKLFFARIFGSEDACPSELEEVSSQILRKCGGLPLAVITIASLLASQATKLKEYWGYVQNSMGSIVGADRRLEAMRQILNLSYKDLPPHLKTCFLYLGAYREDTVVWRDDLVRQWVAEGFVSGMHGVAAAVNWFHELVNRSMIQPVMIDYNGEVLSCRVHDMMLDLIIRKYCKEENFLSVVENSSQGIGVTRSAHNVRRLFHQSNEERRRHLTPSMPAMGIDLSKIRSFSACGSSTLGHIPPLYEFRFIRVLVLEFLFSPEAAEAETVNLKAISKLFQLRYLKIRSEVTLLLPSKIRALQHLETLEIVSALPSRRRHIGMALPSDIAQLPCLSYLSILPQMASLRDGIGAMRSLRSLAFFVLEEEESDRIRGDPAFNQPQRALRQSPLGPALRRDGGGARGCSVLFTSAELLQALSQCHVPGGMVPKCSELDWPPGEAVQLGAWRGQALQGGHRCPRRAPCPCPSRSVHPGCSEREHHHHR